MAKGLRGVCWERKKSLHCFIRLGLKTICNHEFYTVYSWGLSDWSMLSCKYYCMYTCMFVCSCVWAGGLCKFKSKRLFIATHLRCRDVFGNNCMSFAYKYDYNDKNIIFEEALSNNEIVSEISRTWQPDLKCIHILNSR